MSQTFRQPEILDIARREGRVTMKMLAEHFGVTPQTVRRDLTELADLGKHERGQEGAILPSDVTNIGNASRRSPAAEGKARIALACAEAIPDEAAVFIGIGTPAEAVARALARHRNLLVSTNIVNVGNSLLENPDCELVVTGGALRRSGLRLVGALTVRTIEQVRFDHAVIGCSALDATGDLLDHDLEEAVMNQTIIDRSRSTTLVAGITERDRTAPRRLAARHGPPFHRRTRQPGLARSCRSWGTEKVSAKRRGPLCRDWSPGWRWRSGTSTTRVRHAHARLSERRHACVANPSCSIPGGVTQ